MNNSETVCLVTGASSGIGFAISKALMEGGYSVIATARREKQLKELAGADIIAGDIVDHSFQAKLEEHIYLKYGQCNYLFNCAGSAEVASIENMDVDRMTNMLRLNIESVFRLSYLFLKRFKKQGNGHIVNISSVMGTKVRPTAGAYAATKYAMEALSEALRMELTGTRIKVTCIEPGLVMTELHNGWEVHPKEAMGISEPLTAEDIVVTVKFIMNQPSHVRIPRIMILPDDHNI